MSTNSATRRLFVHLFTIAAMMTAVAAPAIAVERIWIGLASNEWTFQPNWAGGIHPWDSRGVGTQESRGVILLFTGPSGGAAPLLVCTWDASEKAHV